VCQCGSFFDVLVSILIPIVSAGVLVASNGRFDINYIDALFVCVSGMTGTGLATIDLSSLTAWQQVIIVLVSLVGSPVCLVFGSHCFENNVAHPCARCSSPW